MSPIDLPCEALPKKMLSRQQLSDIDSFVPQCVRRLCERFEREGPHDTLNIATGAQASTQLGPRNFLCPEQEFSRAKLQNIPPIVTDFIGTHTLLASDQWGVGHVVAHAPFQNSLIATHCLLQEWEHPELKRGVILLSDEMDECMTSLYAASMQQTYIPIFVQQTSTVHFKLFNFARITMVAPLLQEVTVVQSRNSTAHCSKLRNIFVRLQYFDASPTRWRHKQQTKRTLTLYLDSAIAEYTFKETRMRLLLHNAVADTCNLSSRKMGNTCEWLDGPFKNRKMTLHHAHHCVIYDAQTKEYNGTNCVFKNLFLDEKCEHAVDKYRVSRNGKGFKKFLQ